MTHAHANKQSHDQLVEKIVETHGWMDAHSRSLYLTSPMWLVKRKGLRKKNKKLGMSV